MSAGDPRRELVARAQEAHRALSVPAEVPGGDRLSPAQWSVLHGVITGMLRELEAAAGRLTAEVATGVHQGAYVDCEQALMGVERAARVVDLVMSQRDDLRLLAELQLADRYCLDGCDTVLRGTAPAAVAPPVVVIEPNDGPAMTPPDSTIAVPSLFSNHHQLSMPLPFVYVPRSYVRAPWMLPTLQHEIGHSLDHLLKIADDVSKRLPIVSTNDAYADELRRDRWSGWLKEIVADVWGVVLGGADFAWTLALILDGRGLKDFSFGSPAYKLYPPASLRIGLLAETLRQLGLGHRSKRLQELPVTTTIRGKDRDAIPAYRDDLPEIVAAVLSMPVSGGSIRSIVDPQAQDEAFEALARVILDPNGSTKLPDGVRVRHLASAARRALDQDPDAAERIRQRVLDLSDKIEAQPWVVSKSTLKFLREAEYFRPTAADASSPTWKSPPVRLLETHDTIAFVGATHHQLLGKLKLAQRNRPYTRLEMFFLRDESLAWLVTPDCDHEKLIKRRDDGRAQLSAYLHATPAAAQSWTFYLYDHPHFFAAYWDWDKPEGRVHLSPYVWGFDVGNCPGLDIIRGVDPPERYLAYVSGLEALRKMPGTTVIDGNDLSRLHAKLAPEPDLRQ